MAHRSYTAKVGGSGAGSGGEPGYLHDYRFRTWPGGVYHAGYHYNAGYHGGGHRR